MQDTGTDRPIKPFVFTHTSANRAARITAVDSKLNIYNPLFSRSTSVRNYTPNIITVPEELSKSAAWMARCDKQVSFFIAFIESHGSYELKPFPK